MIYETEIVQNGHLRYRVQVRRRLDGVIQQRHIWYQNGEFPDERVNVDPWLCTRARSLEDYIARMKPSTAYLDEFGEAIAALEAIARGHNDARQRAIDALHRIREQTND